MIGSEWRPWFAWYPVFVDAYELKEIRRGKMHYRVWLRWVECQFRLWNDEEFGDCSVWRYRLPRGLSHA